MKLFYAHKKILVTGGAGFIGSHLVEKLVQLEAQVTVLDDLSTGSMNNLNAVDSKIRFIHDSINNLEACIQATHNAEIIFHLAAYISAPQSWQNPEICYKTNVLGTLNVLKSAHQNGTKHIVFSSSSAVYGSHLAACSEDLICKPESPYGHSKLLGELLCKEYAAMQNLSSICLRYFNVYGERQNPNSSYSGVIARFKEQMKNNRALTIFGDGMQERDFVPVDQVVWANLISGTRVGTTDILNIATGRSITLLQLIEELKKEFPSFNAPIYFQAARTGDIKSSKANCSKWHTVQKYLASTIYDDGHERTQ